MVSHYLLYLTVTNQIAFYQQDSSSILKFERAMDRRYQALVSKLETPDTITFTQLSGKITKNVMFSFIVL